MHGIIKIERVLNSPQHISISGFLFNVARSAQLDCKFKRGYRNFVGTTPISNELLMSTAFSARVTTFHAVRSDPDCASASSLGVPMAAPFSWLGKRGAKMAADANSSQLDHYHHYANYHS